ncbi:MAG: hypothetical protein CUN56_00390 [Phototrophicales bacterium]|nr:MAG: hypothetical protein CUN56_00390 [Phototrophicales bacterium]
MISFARVFALAGAILLAVGAFLPINNAANVEALSCDAPTIHQSLVMIDCFREDVKEGFSSSTYGLMILSVAVVGALVVLVPRVGRLWALAFTSSALVGVLFAYFNALHQNQLVGDMDWGWGVIGGGVALLLLAAFIGTLRPEVSA